MTTLPSEYGLYGKVPAFADFVNRRMPVGFVVPWDHWLRRSIAASRDILGEAWLGHYLTSPPWRFALDPGVAGRLSWVGVMASSVDEVRRAFPITVAMALPETTSLATCMDDVETLAIRLEAIALRLIDGSLDVEAGLVEIEQARAAFANNLDGGRTARLRGPSALQVLRIGERVLSPALLLAELGLAPGQDSGQEAPAAMSLWWHAGCGEHAPAVMAHPGLPRPEDFASLLDGAWATRNWSIEGEETVSPPQQTRAAHS